MAERVANSSLRIRTLVLLSLIASGCFTGGCSDDSPAVTSTAITGASTPTPHVSVTEPTQLTTPQTPVQPTESIAGQTGGGGFSGDTIKIGVDLPTSSGEDILAVRNAVQLAIEQSNNSGGVVVAGKAYRLEMYALDDQGDPDIGAKNAQALIADPAVLAVVGPYNSLVATAQMPVFNRADLPNISPSNTAPDLTEPEFGEIKDLRPTGKLTYFRVVAPDSLQPSAGADYMYDKLHARKIYVLDDTGEHGKAFANIVIRRFREDGGTVLGHDSLPSDAQNYQTILKKIADTKPDALYFGGGDMAAIRPGLIRKQMADMGFNIPFVGPADLITSDFLEDAGTTAQGIYGTIPGANAPVLPTAQQFVTDFKTRFGIQLTADFGTQLATKGGYFYAPFAYDAANIIIAAMKQAQAPDRESVRQQIAATKNYPGVLGATSFDENGDTTVRWVSIYEVVNGAWTWFDQINYQGTLP